MPGINFIDTALVYGNGHSETLIGQGSSRIAMKESTLHPKVPPKNYRWPASGSMAEAFPREHILRCAEQTLENLQLERLDLLQLHVWSSDWLAEDDWYAALCQLRETGKISYFGVSINDHEPESALQLVASGRVDTVQVIFNILINLPKTVSFRHVPYQM